MPRLLPALLLLLTACAPTVPGSTRTEFPIQTQATPWSTATPYHAPVVTASPDPVPTFSPGPLLIPPVLLPTPTAEPPLQEFTPLPLPTLTAQPLPDCDPSYPDFCIPPPPPDLDCRDIPQKNFTVLPPDPHRFDGDGDGIGCEG